MWFVHCVQKKTLTYIFNYNSGISWSIFIIFVPVEREINNLQFTYLQYWWRHNCVTLHVTKVYFMELKMNIGRLYWKTPIFVRIITLAFLGRFFYTFWTNGNRNEHFTKNQQNLQQHSNCVSTLPKVKTSHFETTMADRFLECVRSNPLFATFAASSLMLSLIHIWRCRRSTLCRSRWSPYH